MIAVDFGKCGFCHRALLQNSLDHKNKIEGFKGRQQNCLQQHADRPIHTNFDLLIEHIQENRRPCQGPFVFLPIKPYVAAGSKSCMRMIDKDMETKQRHEESDEEIALRMRELFGKA